MGDVIENEVRVGQLPLRVGALATQGVVAGGAVILASQLGPESQAIVAFSAPFAEAAIGGLLTRWRDRTQELGGRAARDCGLEALTEQLQNSPASAALLSEAGYAASRTDYQVKLDAIGEAIAGGVLFEEGVAFDTEALTVRIICQLERAHVTVLSAIVSAPQGLLEEHLAEQFPPLASALPNLLADLQALALVARGRRPSSDLGSDLRRKLRAAGSGGDLSAVIADVLSNAQRETERSPGYRGTPRGLDVMRRFVEAAIRVRDEELAGGATRPLDDVEEYLGPVLPDHNGWQALDQTLDPHHRPVWVLSPEAPACPDCGRRTVVRGSISRWVGRFDQTVLSGESRCPLGHPLHPEDENESTEREGATDS